MPVLTESLLVIDNSRKFDSICVNALSSLGYRSIVHATFEDGIKVLSPYARFDAVVAYWNNELPAIAVSAVIRAARDHCSCDAVLMISSFCTSENVKLFRSAGVCAWVTVPFTRRDLDARLRHALEGERRHRQIPILVERRWRQPMPTAA